MSRSIPNEVLDILLQSIRIDKSGHPKIKISDILCVCKQWRDVGTRLIWKDIILRSPRQILQFASAPVPVAPLSKFALIRSLTLTFAPLETKSRTSTGHWPEYLEDPMHVRNNGNQDTNVLWLALRQLCTILPHLRCLETFSFTVRSSRPVVSTFGFWLRHEDVYCLLTSLPPSLRSLELDTTGYEDTTAADASKDLCAVIATRFAGLEHLRVRLSRYCVQLFVASQTLRTLVVNMCMPLIITTSQQCGDEDANVSDWIEGCCRNGRATRKMLVERGVFNLARFPNLEAFCVVDIAKGERGSFRTVNVRHLVAGVTMSLPFDYLPLPGPDEHKVSLRYENSDDVVVDIVDYLSDMQQLIEGYAWTSTAQGSRFPAAYRDSAEGSGQIWREARRWETRGEFVKRPDGYMIELWRAEERAGRMLLRPERAEGVGEVEGLVRESVPGGDEGL